MRNKSLSVGIIGGGPAGLFMFKELLSQNEELSHIHIFEKSSKLGSGMPYSSKGANLEHITNVSDNEIPDLCMPIAEWVKIAPQELLNRYEIDPARFNEYKVLPRLFFGEYLSAQFDMLMTKAQEKNIAVTVHFNTVVIDVIDNPDQNNTAVETAAEEIFFLNRVIICTGHVWPKKKEGKLKGWYDSPYPPRKLQLQLNHDVGIKGASLTAIDAVRTLARANGAFSCTVAGEMSYTVNEESKGFKLIMHSRNGLLPAVRFHLEDTHLKNDNLLSRDELQEHIAGNNGFLSLDYIFEKDFIEAFREKIRSCISESKT